MLHRRGLMTSFFFSIVALYLALLYHLLQPDHTSEGGRLNLALKGDENQW